MVKEDEDHEENANRAKQKENLRKRYVRVKENPSKKRKAVDVENNLAIIIPSKWKTTLYNYNYTNSSDL